MKLLFAFAVSFLLSSVDSYCQDHSSNTIEGWVYLGKDRDSSSHYMKEKPVKVEDGIVKVWTQKFMKSYTSSGKKYSNVKIMMLQEFDCNDQKIQMWSIVTYDSKGNVLESISLKSYEVEWKDIVPGSLGEMLIEAACALAKK